LGPISVLPKIFLSTSGSASRALGIISTSSSSPSGSASSCSTRQVFSMPFWIDAVSLLVSNLCRCAGLRSILLMPSFARAKDLVVRALDLARDGVRARA